MFLNYEKENATELNTITVDKAKQYIEEGYFTAGAMLPKVEASVEFVSKRSNRKAIITKLDKAVAGLAGKTGTIIVQEN